MISTTIESPRRSDQGPRHLRRDPEQPSAFDEIPDPSRAPARAERGERRLFSLVQTLIALFAAMVGSVALVLALATHLSKSSEYTVFGHPVMTVLSGSMSPTIRTGDLIYDDRISAARAANLQVGQIISFYSSPADARVFTHRIHAVTRVNGQVAYITKGDVNPTPDAQPVLASSVIGLYAGKIPDGGYVLQALRQPLTLLLLLCSPLLWLAGGFLIDWGRDRDGGDRARQRPAHLRSSAGTGVR